MSHSSTSQSELNFTTLSEKYSKKPKHQNDDKGSHQPTSSTHDGNGSEFELTTPEKAWHDGSHKSKQKRSTKDLEIEMHSMLDLIAQLQQNQQKIAADAKEVRVKSWKTTKETAEYLATVAEKKATIPLDKLFWLGIQAGVFVAIGGCFSFIISQGVPSIAAENPAIAKILSGLAFPIALLLITICGGELFTGNAMYFVSGILSGKVTLKHLCLNWAVVWLSNFLGCVAGAFFFGYLTDIFELDPWRAGVEHTAVYKVEEVEIYVLFFRAIPANMLVCLAVYMAICSDDIMSKCAAIYVPICAFVCFEHCIANMFFVPIGLMYGAKTTFGRFLYRNLIVTTLGNIVGGGICVGAISYYLYCTGHQGESKKLWKWSCFPTQDL